MPRESLFLPQLQRPLVQDYATHLTGLSTPTSEYIPNCSDNFFGYVNTGLHGFQQRVCVKWDLREKNKK